MFFIVWLDCEPYHCDKELSWNLKTLLWTPNQHRLSRSLHNTNFYLSFQQKNPKKTSFVVIFTQRVFFLNSSTAVVPQHLDVKDTEYRRILFHHYQLPKIFSQSAQFIKSFVRYTPGLGVPWSTRPCPFLTMPTQWLLK